jgi:hypothetical protein
MAVLTRDLQATIRHVWVEHHPSYRLAELAVTEAQAALGAFIRSAPTESYPSPKAFADAYVSMTKTVDSAKLELRRVELALDGQFMKVMAPEGW